MIQVAPPLRTKPALTFPPQEIRVASHAPFDMVLSFDTELTGLDLWHGCLPYSMQLCSAEGEVHFCDWDVDPLTRIPAIDPNDIHIILDQLEACDFLVLHNPKIDIRALKVAGEYLGGDTERRVALTIKCLWSKLQDTLTKSHALRNLWSHTLKDLRDVFLHVSRKKQEALKIATNAARKICSSKGFIEKYGQWRIADAADPHWPAIKKAPNEKEEEVEGWWLFDTWLPKTIWRLAPEFLPDWPNDGDLGSIITYHLDHPWRTVSKDYAIEDVETTLVLNEVLDEALAKEGLTAPSDRRHRCIEISYEMEEEGIPAFMQTLESETIRYEREAARNAAIVQEIARSQGLEDFNPDSHDQIRDLLFNRWKLPVMELTDPSKKFPQGQPSTNAMGLEKLLSYLEQLGECFAYPCPHDLVVSFIKSHLTKQSNGKAAEKVENWRSWAVNHGPLGKTPPFSPRGWRLHTSYNHTGTHFTRWNSKGPALQNAGVGESIVDELTGEELEDFLIRINVGPLRGEEWLSIDFQSIEYFIWGWSCGNQEIRRVYEAGYSPFKPIMEAIWGYFDMGETSTAEKRKYKKVKNGTYAAIYGAAIAHIDRTYGKMGAFESVCERIPEIKTFTKFLYSMVKANGYITTIGGYRLYVPLDEPHKATSAYVQGHAGWVKQEAMIACHEYLRSFPEIKIIMDVHDEIIFCGPVGFHQRHLPFLSHCMRQAGEKYRIPTPINAKLYRENWATEIAL